jgi:O-antigen/teichoic acid export membrane protein
VLFGKPLLRAWMGPAVALQAGTVLSIVAVSFGLLGLNITGHYALLALGQVRLVSILNLAGGTAMLAVMMLLVPRYGLVGAAIGRLIYGPITLLMYWRLRLLILSRDTRPQSSVPRPVSFLEPEPQLRD